jgi:FkbM family methyltransferase
VNPQRHTGLLYGLRVILVAVLLVAGIQTAIYFYPPLVMVVLSVIGRNPLCSLSDAYHGGQKRIAAEQQTSEIGGRCRLITEDASGLQLWETRLGKYWIPKGNKAVLPILLGQQEADIYAHNSVQVTSGDIVLDCGAHVGLFARHAVLAGAKLVVAVEPSPRNVECLRRNLEEEVRSGMVLIFAGGVWNESTSLTLNSFDSNTAADSFVTGGVAVSRSYQARVVTIDKLVSEIGLPRVDFIKMDIKGAVMKALEGSQLTLSKWKPRMAISTEELPDNPRQIISFVSGLGLNYQVRCGICSLHGGLNVFPLVVFFD